MLTNVVLVIPTLAVLIIVAAYLSVGSLVSEAMLIGADLVAVGGACDPRPDVLARLARLREPRAALGPGHGKVIVREIAPNMSSYLFLTFILLFGGVDPDRRDARLPRARAVAGDVARSDDEQRRLERGAPARHVVVVHPARLGITAIVGGLYVMNVGLDEVFNPRLRDAREPRRRQPPGLLPHAARRREGARRRHLRGRGRRDHGTRRGVRLRQDDAREEPHPAGRPDALRRGHRARSTASAADRRRPGDERVPVPRGLDRPAVRDERAQPDPEDRPHDLGAAHVARSLLRRDVSRAQPPPRRSSAWATTSSTGIRSSSPAG